MSGIDAASIVAILAGIGAILGSWYKIVAERNDITKRDLVESNAFIKSEVEELRSDIKDLRRELAEVRKERDEAIARAIVLEEQVKSLTQRCVALEQHIAQETQRK